ncbi:acyl dehydratase [Blastomonas natatoria]|uniref:Acyl dehydratase n=1 Tax=Blastomonas natatoria TaxID=34015 RepID=A0A2V3UQF7_9SPHN|nr:MaoC family dehydratase [Blastomonas natatoria]PXW69519.1 acyl dehydratase [Blastomonas natatoria]
MSAISPQQMKDMVGQNLGSSEWLLVDQEMINKFADATGDHQFIHVNEEMAKMTPFGGTIAHGFLTLSLFPVLMAKSDCPRVEGVKMGVNYGGNKVRFLAPVRSGKRVRGHFKLLELEEKRPGQWQQTLEFTVEIEGEDKPAVMAEWISQFFV